MPQSDSFISIAITPSFFCENMIPQAITILEECKADFMHLRIPEASEDEIRHLIECFPMHLYSKLKIHSHYHLAEEYHLGGVHLNSRAPTTGNFSLHTSRSCHSIEEILRIESLGINYEYVTLSPVFDSISKKDYCANISILENMPADAHTPIIALGGVTPEKFPFLQKKGFAGAAMLGYFFQL